MKYLKTIAFTAVVGAALMAFGAGSASAATVICSSTGGVASAACNVGTHTQEYSGPIDEATTAGAANQAKLVTNLGTVSCDSASTGDPSASTGTPTITGSASFAFTNCTFSAGGTCTVEMLNQPYTAHTEGTVGGNTNAFKEVVTGLSMHVVCDSFINCIFGKPEVTLNGTNGSPTSVSANGIALNREGGFFCPSSVTWTAKYDVTSPSGGVTVH